MTLRFTMAIVVMALVSPALPACTARAEVTLHVSAAASLTDALTEINALYMRKHKNVIITPNFASSGTLQKQIEQGAPCDLFISAAADQMDALERADLLLGGTRKNILKNRVVLVVPDDSTLGIASFADLVREEVKKIAIGDPKSVPAGAYGQQAFDELGITAKIQSKLVLASDVRQVLSYVETGNVDAGVVYSTDTVASTGVRIAASGPESVNARIAYPIAVIKASHDPEAAKAYEDFLFSSEATAVLEKNGFAVQGK
jgi:molybdate transport system substrate-binding protein